MHNQQKESSRDPHFCTGPCFIVQLSAAATATVVAIVTTIVAAAGEYKDQDDDPPAAVTAEKAIVVAHKSFSSFRCAAQISRTQHRDLHPSGLSSVLFVLSTLHHI